MPQADQITSLEHAVSSYNSVLSLLLDKHAPATTVKFFGGKNHWWSSKCQTARSSRRAAERQDKKDLKLKSPTLKESHQRYKESQVDAAIVIDKERNNYYQTRLSSITGDAKATFKVVNKLLDKEYGTRKLPNGNSNYEIANDLKDFFHSKITSIYSGIEKHAKDSTIKTSLNITKEAQNLKNIKFFKLLTQESVEDIIKDMGTKSCEIDPIPTWLFKNCLQEILPIVTLIVNLSLQTGNFPEQMKSAIVRATLKNIILILIYIYIYIK